MDTDKGRPKAKSGLNREIPEGAENACRKTEYNFRWIFSETRISFSKVLSVLICVHLWIRSWIQIKTSQAGGVAVRCQNVCRLRLSQRGRAVCDRAGRVASSKVRKFPRWRPLLH